MKELEKASPDNGNSAITKVNSNGIEIKNMEDLQRFCRMALHAKIFKSAADLAKACMIAQFGMEMGVSPATALQNMHMVEGRVCVGAVLMAGLVKRSDKYTYKVTKHDREGCTIMFIEKGVGELGVASYEKEDAQLAQLLNKHNWKRHPKAMYYARAISAGCRMYAPDVFLGATVHTPEEISEGEYVDHQFAEAFGLDDVSRDTEKEVFSAADALKKEIVKEMEENDAA